MFKRAIVIGCPGAGKSTFSRALREKTGLPLYYLDMLWHRPDRTTAGRDEFDRRLKEILSRDQWIIDGNYGRTLEPRLRACDAVFLLDLPVAECLAAAEARVGEPREDMPWVETELEEEFRQWRLEFPERELPVIEELLSRYGEGREVCVFRSREEMRRYLENRFE